VRSVKSNNKGHFKYTDGKRKTGENVVLLLNEVEDLLTQDIEKAEVPNDFFTSVFTS